jgi:carboxymethylenebutenolidase
MRIELPSGTPAELARPTAGEPTAGLVLIPDIMGLRPLFDEHCARLADEHGWVVCAVEPFPDHQDMPLEERLQFVGNLRDERLLGDLVAAADATGQDRVGIIGFCMGGMVTLKATATGRFDRAVAFYGMIRIPDHWRGDDTGEPLDALAKEGRCPAMAIIGTADEWTPPDDVDVLEAAGVEVVRYEGAEHGFVHDPSRPTHRAADAADAWSRAIAFLAG